jgi:hypothetical protein
MGLIRLLLEEVEVLEGIVVQLQAKHLEVIHPQKASYQ